MRSLLFCGAVLACLAAVSCVLVEADNGDTSWDYLLFVQQWPGNDCQLDDCKNLQVWTIHGLWPNRNDGTYPAFCTSEAFDPSELASIKTDLTAVWPSLMGTGNSTDFHGHEWDKHGTCAASIKALDTQLEYFSAGIDLHNQLQLRSTLDAAGIVPSDTATYDTKDIATAFQSHVGQTVAMYCRNGNILDSVGVCFDKSLTYMDCPADLVSPRQACSGQLTLAANHQF